MSNNEAKFIQKLSDAGVPKNDLKRFLEDECKTDKDSDEVIAAKKLFIYIRDVIHEYQDSKEVNMNKLRAMMVMQSIVKPDDEDYVNTFFRKFKEISDRIVIRNGKYVLN